MNAHSQLTDLLQYDFFYLVGVKGVAMTSLAQCLLDAGKKVTGSDLAEEFVTQPLLKSENIKIDLSFETEIPAEVDCLIYTAAHQAQQNPQVIQAQKRRLPVYSQAEAIAALFNQKKGIAVCGVGGKSTTSAMISWILEKTGCNPSFSVGVGDIPGMKKTGKWSEESQYFVAEADEYVIDPTAPSRGVESTPRFSFFHPFLTVCTNLKFDHPDVYKDLDHTVKTFETFFNQVQSGGFLIFNKADEELGVFYHNVGITTYSFGSKKGSDFWIDPASIQAELGSNSCNFFSPLVRGAISLKLQIPGYYNLENAVAAIAACSCIGVPAQKAATALATFRSTLRRCQFIGEKNQVKYYDDYAHHPHEVQKVIAAYREWFPTQRLVVAFQSHTYSRTKSLFADFVTAFKDASEVWMMDIFPSAREAVDMSITSDMLCTAIQERFPEIPARNLENLNDLACYSQKNLRPGNVLLTIGAGDIYKIHDLITDEGAMHNKSMTPRTPLQESIHHHFSHLSPEFNYVLAPLTYFKIGGPAEVFLDLKSRQDIIAVVKHCQEQQFPMTILAGASNVVVSDKGLVGVVIRASNEEYSLESADSGDGKKIVRVGAGYKTALFVRKTIDEGLQGLEYFLGVPGKVGGAVYNNAHYLRDLIGEHIHRVEVITDDSKVKWLSTQECDFKYDFSRFHHTKEIILQAEFKLAEGNQEESMTKVKEATIYRAQTQPLGEPSSGCYFRNTPMTPNLAGLFPQFAQRAEFPTAFLIDQAGLKGTRVGGIQVSAKHAAFFINLGQGTSQEVKELAKIVKQRVLELYGVELEEEVFFLE